MGHAFTVNERLGILIINSYDATQGDFIRVGTTTNGFVLPPTDFIGVAFSIIDDRIARRFEFISTEKWLASLKCMLHGRVVRLRVEDGEVKGDEMRVDALATVLIMTACENGPIADHRKGVVTVARMKHKWNIRWIKINLVHKVRNRFWATRLGAVTVNATDA